ncbi:MAG: hypothetical protein WCF40_02405, partial [Desulfobacterales bacterium]
MRFPVFSRKGLFTVHRTAAVLAAAVMLFCFAGGGLSSTGGEQGTEHAAPPAKGWQATDTYKVMN